MVEVQYVEHYVAKLTPLHNFPLYLCHGLILVNDRMKKHVSLLIVVVGCGLFLNSCSSSISARKGVSLMDRDAKCATLKDAKVNAVAKVSRDQVLAVWEDDSGRGMITLYKDTLAPVWSMNVPFAKGKIDAPAVHIVGNRAVIPYTQTDSLGHAYKYYAKVVDLTKGQIVDSMLLAAEPLKSSSRNPLFVRFSPDSSKVLLLSRHLSSVPKSYMFITTLFDPTMHLLAKDSVTLPFDVLAKKFLGAYPDNTGHIMFALQTSHRDDSDSRGSDSSSYDIFKYDLLGGHSLVSLHAEFQDSDYEKIRDVRAIAGTDGKAYVFTVLCYSSELTRMALACFDFTTGKTSVQSITVDDKLYKSANLPTSFDRPEIRSLYLSPTDNNLVVALEELHWWNGSSMAAAEAAHSNMEMMTSPVGSHEWTAGALSQPTWSHGGGTVLKAGNVLLQAFDLNGSPQWHSGFTKSQTGDGFTSASYYLAPTSRHSLKFWYADGDIQSREFDLKTGILHPGGDNLASVGNAATPNMELSATADDDTYVFYCHSGAYIGNVQTVDDSRLYRLSSVNAVAGQ
jgi:hypothetical protein